MSTFSEVAPGVHVLRYPVLDVNVTLVVGDGRALVVDTLATTAQAGELLAAVRRVTALPLWAVNTHHHFDHCFGNAALAATGAAIWAHRTAVTLMDERGEVERQAWSVTEPTLAVDLAATELRLPDHAVGDRATLDLGDRPVSLLHPGRGHTAGDLAVL